MEIMSSSSSSSSRFPFTSTQWQELEHQALVYKYMISGMPIPPDLLFSIQRSLDSSTRLIMHHHSPNLPIGREYFQMGFGRKIDPEPGRCRRTDGKKWRCSKEVYPDSKYCERHMHRGRNRSRKPVEPSTASSTPPLTSICAKSSSTYHPSPFAYPQQLSRSSPAINNNNVLSTQDHGFLLESSPYSHSEKDHSYVMKEDVDEHHPYLSESGTMSDSWHLEPLAMKSSPLAQSQSYQNESYSYQKTSAALKQDHYDQLALKVEVKDEPQKVMHHFFDEAPHDGGDHNKDKDSSTTQLSISIPDCARDFFLAHNDK